LWRNLRKWAWNKKKFRVHGSPFTVQEFRGNKSFPKNAWEQEEQNNEFSKSLAVYDLNHD
jgi:hypothetical protein